MTDTACTRCDEKTSHAYALAVFDCVKFERNVADIYPLCHLVTVMRRIASDNGVHLNEPTPEQVARLCDELLSVSFYHTPDDMQLLTVIVGYLYPRFDGTGIDFGYQSAETFHADLLGLFGQGQVTKLRQLMSYLPLG